MELKVEVGFNELLFAVKQLPENQLEILKREISKKQASPTDVNSFAELLLNGPVMSDEQYKEFKETRKKFNKWRSK